jgi:ABC-2 type transport system permease protein
MLRALKAELLKLKRSSTPRWTVLIALVAPAFCWVVSEYSTVALSWEDFMRTGPALLAGWYGTVLFALATAYVFGREYAEGTAKEMLTQPIRREWFLAAKTAVLVAWLLGLTLLSVIAQAILATLLGLKGPSWSVMAACLGDSLTVAVLIFATLPVVALLAIRGGGYLAPMAYSAVVATVGLGLAEIGWTRWFPWSMQIAVAGMGLFPAAPMPGLVAGSWVLMACVFVAGSAAVVWCFNMADNTE